MADEEIEEIVEKVYDPETKSVALQGEFDADTLQQIVNLMRSKA